MSTRPNTRKPKTTRKALGATAPASSGAKRRGADGRETSGRPAKRRRT